MSFEQVAYLAQIVASIGVIVSLVFVGLQIRQNTGARAPSRVRGRKSVYRGLQQGSDIAASRAVFRPQGYHRLLRRRIWKVSAQDREGVWGQFVG